MGSAQEPGCQMPTCKHLTRSVPSNMRTVCSYCKKAPEVGRKAPHTSGETKPGVGPGVRNRRAGVILCMVGSGENTAGTFQDRHTGRQDFLFNTVPSHTHLPRPLLLLLPGLPARGQARNQLAHLPTFRSTKPMILETFR